MRIELTDDGMVEIISENNDEYWAVRGRLINEENGAIKPANIRISHDATGTEHS